jgi:prepilin-type N-terminal cleavage/methylation domain-containing protein
MYADISNDRKMRTFLLHYDNQRKISLTAYRALFILNWPLRAFQQTIAKEQNLGEPMKSPHSFHRRSAYTLTEILVVIGIICILAGLSFAVFRAASKTADKYDAIAKTAQDHLAAPNASAKRVPKSLLGQAKSKKPSQPKTDVPSAIPGEYIVTFTPGVADAGAEAQRLATRYGGKVLSVYTRIQKACALKIPDSQFAAFRADPAIATVDKNLRVYALQQQTPTGVSRTFSYPSVPPSQLILRPPIRHQPKRNILFKGPTAGYSMINVAVMDSGIDSSHPDLNVVMSLGFGGFPDGEDQDGHGTHVAGIIGAIDNDIGVVGVYPGAPLWSLRVLDTTGAGKSNITLEALDYVYAHANVIRVCNMSFGSAAVDPPVNAAVDKCVKQGVVMVAAAGNDAKPASGYSPASASLVICVAAMADSDGRPGALGPATTAGPDDTFATFSNFDKTVTVIAPGVDILSTLPGGSYGLKNGTSMAAPHVAGYCALLLDPTTIFGRNNRNLFFPFSPDTPPNMAAYLRSIATERIKGINGDPLTYPMVNFRVQ